MSSFSRPLCPSFLFFFIFFTQVTPKEQAQDEYNWRDPNGTATIYWHPLQRTISTWTHGKRQEFVSFPWSQEDRRRGSKPPIDSLLHELQTGRAGSVRHRPVPQPLAPHSFGESSNDGLNIPRDSRVHLFQTQSRTGTQGRDSFGSDAGCDGAGRAWECGMVKDPDVEARRDLVLQPVLLSRSWLRRPFNRYRRGSSFEHVEHPPPEHPSPYPLPQLGSRTPVPPERKDTWEVGSGVPPLGRGSRWSPPLGPQGKQGEQPIAKFGQTHIESIFQIPHLRNWTILGRSASTSWRVLCRRLTKC